MGPVAPPVFLFVVDTCMIEEEIGYLKSALAQAIELLPDQSLVGFITFGTYVQVPELGFGLLPKSYVFKGTKEVTKEQILDQMSFFAGKTKPTTGVIAGARNGLSAESIARFLLPASECEFVLNSVIEELQKDPWPVPADKGSSRCTGVALSVAASLLGVCVPGSGARIMAFVGGPSTEGPGSESYNLNHEKGVFQILVTLPHRPAATAMIVSKSLSEPIRSHKDLDKGSAPLYNKAVKFYEDISKQLVNQGHVLDLFTCALDQVGVAVERTGGIVVLAESSGHSVFKDSLRCFFQSSDNDLDLSFNLSPRLSIFPRFMFNLRRSQFVQVFNNSPDETAYFTMMLNIENVSNAVVMIQPSLISYSFQLGAEPVLLDVTAIAADRILLLDSYFTVVIFHGITIAQWRKAGYQYQEGHESFAQLLQAPQEEADAIIKERFPVPRLVVCDQYGSQARFLLAKLNPSVSYDNPPAPGGDVIFTDDVSFQVFMDNLQRLAVH
ncbi:unnamed protein product [Miscanthus lutarioriparius]|uniref:Protein transport protein SEC23 n=1 Tax=Miscanthus lutarioriparius TaxID=422564 RepID=A0A811QCC4_9POAL|nr:unnamed protein product [Miscanthus lutarioriparius]